jgi:hypothetical protein
MSCQLFGFTGGTLACHQECSGFVTTGWITEPSMPHASMFDSSPASVPSEASPFM